MIGQYFFAGFVATQMCAGAVLIAVMVCLHRREPLRLLLTGLAIALATAAPALIDPYALGALKTSAALATIYAIVGRRRGTIVVAVLVELALLGVSNVITNSIATLASFHMLGIAVVVATDVAPRSVADARAGARPIWRSDWIVFAAATLVAAIVCVVVLERHTLSGDEWADTYQADLYGHLKAYGSPPPCPNVFKAWWVFDWHDRMFAQYTPGWPLLMAPFQRVGLVWLANPVVFGAGAVGVARLARRALAKGGVVAASVGILAAALLSASCAATMNAGSRYPHTSVCTAFAWLVEAACVVTLDDVKPRARIGWGILLGAAGAFALAIRPLDGLALGTPVAVYFLWSIVKKRVATPALVATVASFVFWGGLTLVLLRLQIGVWFKTGYGIAGQLRDLPAIGFSLPKANELAPVLGFDKGPMWWWPCHLALGGLGLTMSRHRSRQVVGLLGAAAIVQTLAYVFVDLGRDGEDSGYSPRYHLPIIIPLSVGTAVALAPLVERALEHGGAWLARTAPLALAGIAVAIGVRNSGEDVYPGYRIGLHEKRALFRAIETADLRNAVVVVRDGELAMQAWDLTQNLPTATNPNVYIITDFRAGEDMQCARRTFADRRWYRAAGKSEVTLTPF